MLTVSLALAITPACSESAAPRGDGGQDGLLQSDGVASHDKGVSSHDNAVPSDGEVITPDSAAPSCSDGKMNGQETGIDCGGNCPQACPTITGTTYYVSNAGKDSNSGTSAAQAWQTIGKVNGASLKPGDGVRFRRGDVWREQLMIKWSGTQQKPVYFGSYDKGAKPAIYGSAAITSWTQVSGQANVWKSVQQVDDPSCNANHDGQTKGDNHCWPGGGWFVHKSGGVHWGNQEQELKNGLGSLKAPYDWGWLAKSIYVYSTADPATLYTAFEASQRSSAIQMPGGVAVNWVVIEGLQLLYTRAKGFYAGYPEASARGLTIRNCHVAYVGIKDGLAADGLKVWHSDALYENNEIHDCGRHGIGLLVLKSPVAVSNVRIVGNHFYHGWHTTGIDVQTQGAGSSIANVEIRGNLFEGSPGWDIGGPEGHNSNHVLTAKYNGTLSNFTYVNNVFTYTHGKGLTIGDIKKARIYNNTFYGVNPTLANGQGQLWISGSSTDIEVRNNIVYTDVDTSFNGGLYGVFINVPRAQVTMDTNLYYSTDPKAPMIKINGITGSFQTSEWSSYKSTTSWDANSPPPADPGFVNAPSDLHVGAGSPAKAKGQSLPGVTTDREGKTRGSKPTIGAYE